MGDFFGGGSNTTTVDNKPWGPAKEPVKKGIREAERLYDTFTPEYYPGSTVAPLSGYSQEAIDAMAARARAGSPLQDAARQGAYDVATGGYMGGPGYDFLLGPMAQYMGNYMQTAMGPNPALEGLSETAAGKYINANPYIDDVADRIGSQMAETYAEGTRPRMESLLAGRGRGISRYTGDYSNTGQNMLQRSDEAFSRGVGDTMADLYYGDYGRERGYQEAAARDFGNLYNSWLSGMGSAGMAGRGYGSDLDRIYQGQIEGMLGGGRFASDLAQQDYGDIERLGSAGTALDQYSQQLLQDEIDRFNYYQTGAGSPVGNLNTYLDLLNKAQGKTGATVTEQPGTGLGPFGDLVKLGIGVGGLFA